jgi:hypothetical protein
MLTKPSVKQLEALSAVTRLPYWSEVNGLLEAELRAVVERMIDTPDERELRQLQGMAKFIKKFQEMASNAPEHLARQGRTSPLM